MKTRAAPGELGQVLPLFTLFLIVLLGMAALAVDISSVYSAERFYRSSGDAAALAGAQDLQQGNTRTVTSVEQARARGHSMDVLASRLGATSIPTGGQCDPAADIVDCALPGTPYVVSIKTPSPTCVSCDPERSVQVRVRHPAYGLTFARLLGQSEWNVEATSVAGLTFAGKYAIQTLRPPKPLPNGLDQHRENIDVNGTNTWLKVVRGDIGTNTSAYTNSGGRITLGPGYRIDHIDDITPDPWNKDLSGNPRGRLITRLIPDPAHPIASFEGAPSFRNQANGETPCTGADFPADYRAILDGGLNVKCYAPGVYERNFSVQTNTDVAYLMPGAYRFDGGIDVRGYLLGGLVRSRPGVAIVVPQSQTLTANNTIALWLNLGDETCAADDCRAEPARDHAGNPVETPEGLILSIEVPRDPSCFSGTTPILCSDTNNDTVRLPGNGQIRVAGVIYAPSDNIQINGDNTSQEGLVGQIIAWTVKYSGGAKLNQDYPGAEEVGTLRLDAACSAPSEPCNE
jgi:hypothetical protein